MNSENNREMEIKLTTLSPELLAKILQIPLVKERIIVGSERDKYLESHYYDTPKRRFAKAGVVFRVRKEPEGFVATVKVEKSNSGGLSERMEYNVSLHDEQPTFGGFDKINFIINLQAIVAKEGGVQELFSVNVQRKQCELMLSDETVVEMAVDTGGIIAGEKCLSVHELELEIKKGKSSDLIDFVALLANEVPLFAEQKSKYYRGCELSGEQIEQIKAKSVEEISTAKPFKSSVQSALVRQTGYALCVTADCIHDKGYMPDLYTALTHLKKMLVFFGNIFEEKQCQEQIKKIENLIDLIEKQRYVGEFASLWQRLNARTETITTNMLLEKLLNEKDRYYTNLFTQEINSGKYSVFLFSLWSWLMKGNWQENTEITGKDYLYEQIVRINNEVQQLYEKEDILGFYDRLLLLIRNINLMKKFSGKDARILVKAAKKLAKQVKNKMLAEKTAETLFSLFRASAGRLLYRDAGILLGYYLKAYAVKEKKLDERMGAYLAIEKYFHYDKETEQEED